MLGANSKANTMISQSFIASQFQGYNQPYVNSNPTSSLNQFVRQKQTSDSGFIQQGQNKAFGFNNITSNHEPSKLQSFSRKATETIQVNGSQVNGNTGSQFEKRVQSNNSNSSSNFSSNKQQFNKIPVQQVILNERYTSPGIVKTDSPTKFSGKSNFQQQQLNQQGIKVQAVQNLQNNYRANQQQSFNQAQSFGQQQGYSQQQAYNQQQSGYNQQVQAQKSRVQSSSSRVESNQQQARVPSSINQPSQHQNNAYRATNQVSSNQIGLNQGSSVNQKGNEGSSIGKRLKLNISQQFSDSFTLKCVSQPQKSSILQMKKRQREYRKSIQNFFV